MYGRSRDAGASRYAYVGNDPINGRDPTGTQDSRAGQAQDRDMRDWAEGRITEEEYRERRDARGAGALTGAAVVGTALTRGLGLPSLFTSMGRMIGRGRTLAIESAQFGKKAVSHMRDFGLDVSNASHREIFRKTIEGIASKPDKIVKGTFLGQGANGARGPVTFFIKGNDVVVATPKGQFVTILKDGINSQSVINALRATR